MFSLYIFSYPKLNNEIMISLLFFWHSLNTNIMKILLCYFSISQRSLDFIVIKKIYQQRNIDSYLFFLMKKKKKNILLYCLCFERCILLLNLVQQVSFPQKQCSFSDLLANLCTPQRTNIFFKCVFY